MNVPTSKQKLIQVAAALFLAGCLLLSCQAAPVIQEPSEALEISEIPAGLSENQALALASLTQVDDFPLYTMVYQADNHLSDNQERGRIQNQGKVPWACSLFAAFGDPQGMLVGRNFDWSYSPGLLLFYQPLEGYRSVSMVDIAYLGFGDERAEGITDLPLERRRSLLNAPWIPFDGMNEAGLVVGMAAVPPGEMDQDPSKETIDSVMVIRKILDQAATLEEAIQIIRSYNIDMGGNYLHYLIAEKSGRSVLVEFSQGEMVVHPNQGPYQVATNFLLAEAGSDPGAHCGRFRLLDESLKKSSGQIDASRAMDLLEDVAQPSTQWSIVYLLSEGEIWISLGRDYRELQRFNFEAGLDR